MAQPEEDTGVEEAFLELGDRLLAPRWVAPLFLAFSILLLPWIVYLAFSLPTRNVARHYNVSWIGFDVLLILAMARTAWLAFRQRRQLELWAMVTATLLVVDAWFDVTTAHRGWPFVQAVLQAIFVELPTAALALYLARRVERITAREQATRAQRFHHGR
jgi:hypothetical protein